MKSIKKPKKKVIKETIEQYKNLFIISILILLFTSCTNLPKDTKWNYSKDVGLETRHLEVGDIMVKSRELNPLSWYGHAAMIVGENIVGDYPEIIDGYYEIDPYSWLYDDRDVIVLRYKNMNKKFKRQLIINIQKYKGKRYWLNLNKRSNKAFYCSQFIWYVYWQTAQDLGFKLDLDGDGGFMIMPYDLLKSKDLIPIRFREY